MKIYEELYRHFHNYDYRLSNSFVYEWESDFFAQSKSGYFVEVEVKVSRGDFFRDFAKPKHSLFKDIRAGKTHHITHQPTRGDEIGRVVYGKLVTEYGEYARWTTMKDNWRTGNKNGKWGYWVNDYGHTRIDHFERPLFASATYINIRPIENIKCPNQLYFACPDGLIKSAEIPEYAGLLWLTNRGIEQIKKAPYIHKRKQDLDKILLRKFYNLWQYKTTLAEKVATSTSNPDSITT
jgi:hypothetical protein